MILFLTLVMEMLSDLSIAALVITNKPMRKFHLVFVPMVSLLHSQLIGEPSKDDHRTQWERLRDDYGSRLEPVWDARFPDRNPSIVLRGSDPPDPKIEKLMKHLNKLRLKDDGFSLYLIYKSGSGRKSENCIFLGCLARGASGDEMIKLYSFDCEEERFLESALSEFRASKDIFEGIGDSK